MMRWSLVSNASEYTDKNACDGSVVSVDMAEHSIPVLQSAHSFLCFVETYICFTDVDCIATYGYWLRIGSILEVLTSFKNESICFPLTADHVYVIINCLIPIIIF